MILRAVVLLFVFAVAVYCWLRVFNKPLRQKTRPWWWSLSNKADGEKLNDAFDLLATLAGAFVTTVLFVYIAGLGYWWK